MRTLKFLLQKEFRQIFRDPSIVRMILMMPIVQLILLPLAANYEVKDVKLAIVDHDHSSYTQQMINKITASGYFQLIGVSNSYNEEMKLVEKDEADIILEIPAQFERTIVKENEAPLFMAVNAINGTRANLGSAYLQNIIRNYNQDIRTKWIQMPRFNDQPLINITYADWYNPHMNYQLFMVPGILAVLLTMVGAFMTALNIVKEKEVGTIEQINVTPIRKHHFILGKLIPFWILGLVVLTLGFGVARVVYGIVPLGSFVTIYVFAMVYLLAVLGLGLLVSTYSNTQQQAMLISFFLMMIFILLGGLYTSIDSMPQWAQWITKFNPVSYFIEVVRMVVIKGSTLKDISNQLLIMFGFAIALNGWAIFNYKKRM
ncbi:MAG TPA: ABC transporter permease [Panacibacter sp.]|nr:ABC transporter permease [Panacibacter sp.]